MRLRFVTVVAHELVDGFRWTVLRRGATVDAGDARYVAWGARLLAGSARRPLRIRKASSPTFPALSEAGRAGARRLGGGAAGGGALMSAELRARRVRGGGGAVRGGARRSESRVRVTTRSGHVIVRRAPLLLEMMAAT